MKDIRVRVRLLHQWESFQADEEVNLPAAIAEQVVSQRLAVRTTVPTAGPSEAKVVAPAENKEGKRRK